MARYAVSPTSKVTVRARSSIHDTTTVWDRVEGTIEADPERVADAGATATFRVDMTRFDAGDFLKNRKLRKDFDLDAHPTASFEITGLREVVRTGDRFTAIAEGVLGWRGKRVPIAVRGTGTFTASALDVTGSFDLDIRDLGLKAPRFLMFKVEDEVTVEVALRASVAG
jgi:polyisoprenoid-binding protein YceI